MNREQAAAARAIGNPNLAAYARALADHHPGGSLPRLSAACAAIALNETRRPGPARVVLNAVRITDVRDVALQLLDELLSLAGGIMADMNTVPPVINSRTAGGPAYLLERHELPNGEQGAEIAWMVWTGTDWAGRRQKVLAADLEEVDGQDYSGVPMVRAAELARRAARASRGAP